MKTLIYILLTILLVGHPDAGVKIESIEEPVKAAVVVLDTEITETVGFINNRVNQERMKIGLKPLTENQKLVDSATAKACHLRDNNYWGHVSPDGTTPWGFFNEAGYVYRYAGENLCKHYTEAGCMSAWMKSEKHRDNILDSRFKEIGTGKCGVYTVQHFGLRN